MESFQINDFDSLLSAADVMHDSGFTLKDIEHDEKKNMFVIKTRKYRYKGKLIQTQTNSVECVCKLILYNAKEYKVIEKDIKGYQTTKEDYINTFKLKNSKIIRLTTMFHEIQIKIDILQGAFEYYIK